MKMRKNMNEDEEDKRRKRETLTLQFPPTLVPHHQLSAPPTPQIPAHNVYIHDT